jgi:hypothetical protein
MTRARDVSNIDGLLTTTGDTYYASAAGTPARLGIGSTSQVLTVAAGVPSWATPASGTTFVGAYVTGATVTPANNTLTTVPFNAESFDTNAFHDNATNNSRITVPAGKAGYYMFTASGQYNNNTNGRREMYMAKNGTLQISSDISPSGGTYPTPLLALPIYLAVSDYVEVKLYQSSGAGLDFYGPSMTVSYLGA